MKVKRTTHRHGMGREEGGVFRIGNTCIPVADSFCYMAKPIQYCKVKKKNRYRLTDIENTLMVTNGGKRSREG